MHHTKLEPPVLLTMWRNHCTIVEQHNTNSCHDYIILDKLITGCPPVQGSNPQTSRQAVEVATENDLANRGIQPFHQFWTGRWIDWNATHEKLLPVCQATLRVNRHKAKLQHRHKLRHRHKAKLRHDRATAVVCLDLFLLKQCSFKALAPNISNILSHLGSELVHYPCPA